MTRRAACAEVKERLGVAISEERIRSARAGGFWQDQTLLDYFDRNVARDRGGLAIAGYDSTRRQAYRITHGELDRRVRALAAGLARRGIEPGDIVSTQLPNGWQTVAMHLAALRVGAIFNPLMPMFRERELSFMLGLAESKLIVVPERFRKCEHGRMLHALHATLPALEHVLVIGADAPGTFDCMLEEEPGDTDALFAQRRPSPDDVIELLYTSGSTGEPKGVLHTSNTLMANLLQHARAYRFDAHDVTLMPSPLAHQTGFLYGIMNPIMSGGTVILQDVWDPAEAVGLVEREGVTFSIGATPFLSDLLDAAEPRPQALRSLRNYVSGGAPIPPTLVRRATERFGIRICCMWGMTENGPVAFTRPEDPLERMLESDGCVARGMEMKVVDEAGSTRPTGVEGRLLVRGAGLFVGYLKRPQLNATDAEGWFDTGDLARMDGHGYIRITGRSKDTILRGGEHVPAVEVENLMYLHPAIAQAAVVAMPDPRLGERACAFVVLRPGYSLTLAQLSQHLLAQHCARTYLPERLELVQAMPRTPTGKIQKFILRERVRALAAQEGN
jgi:cyclohexanecarboxylate-CoA ligase